METTTSHVSKYGDMVSMRRGGEEKEGRGGEGGVRRRRMGGVKKDGWGGEGGVGRKRRGGEEGCPVLCDFSDKP